MSAAFSRREFMRLIGTGAAGAAFPGFVGCATTGSQKPVGRVVVIGGGYGGTTAAKYIRLWSRNRIDVTLVEQNAQFVSCPLSNLVLGGSRDIASGKILNATLRFSFVSSATNTSPIPPLPNRSMIL